MSSLKKMFRLIPGVILLLLSCNRTLLRETPPPVVPLSARLDSLLDAPELANAIVGICVHSLKTADTLYEKNAHTLLVPASNLKLLTTATALRTLGPDYRFTTRLYLDGAIRDSTYYGDLILHGGGDPTLVWVDSCAGVPRFQSLVRDLRALGIRTIKGRLIGDDSFFDDQFYAVGWSWENDPYSFQPELSALSINNNCVDFTLYGESPGAPASIQLSPPFPHIHVDNKIKTAQFSDVSIERQRGTNTFSARGTIKTGETLRRTRTIFNPTQSAAELFGLLLNDAGIACDSIVDMDDLPTVFYNPDSTLYLEVQSPLLADIITDINKKSQNLAAELVLKCMGKELLGDGSSAAGARVVMEYWAPIGLNSAHTNMVDGSGLSRKNLLTAAGLVAVLKSMRSDSVFYHSLPVSGFDGTLNGGLWTNDRNVRAKTGTLDYVKALSGYIDTQTGDELAFSFILNHHLVDAEKIIYIQNRFCQILAQQ